MPNQYTKFKEASTNLRTREFRWREYGKKVKGGSLPSSEPAPGESGKAARQTDPKGRAASNASSDRSSTGSTVPEFECCDAIVKRLPGDGLRIDPFKAYPVKPSHPELEVLDYFLHILSPSSPGVGLTNSDQPLARHVDPHINMLLPYVMRQAVLFDALLASCQASIVMSKGLSAYDDHFFLSHRARAMSGLRDKLALEEFDGTEVFMSVSMLLTAEYLVGNLDGVIAHTKGLHQLMATRAPLPTKTAWDRFVKHGVEAYKSLGYFAAGQTIGIRGVEHPLLEVPVDLSQNLSYCSLPVSDDLSSILATIPPGFADLVLSGQISTQLLGLISTLQILHSDPSTILRRNDPISPGSTSQQIQAALNRFSQHSQITHLEKCIVAGLTAYSFQFPRRTNLNLFHDPILQGMVQTLSKPYRPGPEIERQVFMWIAMSVEAIMAVRASRLPGSYRIFYKALDMHPDMLKWETLTPILKRFFWCPKAMEHWIRCWELGFEQYTIVQMRGISSESEDTSRGSVSTPSLDSPDSSAFELPSWHPSPSSYTAEVSLCPFRR